MQIPFALFIHSIEIILIDLPRHHHHPQQKHRPDDVERKRRLPVITYALGLLVRQGRLAVRQARARAVEVAVAIDGALGAVELDGGLDEAGQEEDEEDEGAEDDDAGEELPLLDEDEDDEEEEEAERAGCYAVGEYPDTSALVAGLVLWWEVRVKGAGRTYHGTPRWKTACRCMK